ncbi:MAG: ATP-binding protein [Cypionkella sp.]|uniref:ATP-binding protein n=1 Tax=Cypionkella sp. TaxID=2811411 RepID=UPI002AB8EC79|nr:ATP-binding protein [Cypionkella sp.]MDZ4312096.1 ATP-binding protein [Cypionkella sp.]
MGGGFYAQGRHRNRGWRRCSTPQHRHCRQPAFNGWDQNFPDKPVTVATIDRLIHRASVFEMNAESLHQRTAAANKLAQDHVHPTTLSDNQTEAVI